MIVLGLRRAPHEDPLKLRHALPFLALLLLPLTACATTPPLTSGERFEVSARRNEAVPGEALVRVAAIFEPPIPELQALHASATLDSGVVTLEIKGWHKAGPPRAIEATVGVRPGIPFLFAVLYKGHRDEYQITVPEQGPIQIVPDSGEFTSRVP
jgi:hypothetical protein